MQSFLEIVRLVLGGSDFASLDLCFLGLSPSTFRLVVLMELIFVNPHSYFSGSLSIGPHLQLFSHFGVKALFLEIWDYCLPKSGDCR